MLAGNLGVFGRGLLGPLEVVPRLEVGEALVARAGEVGGGVGVLVGEHPARKRPVGGEFDAVVVARLGGLPLEGTVEEAEVVLDGARVRDAELLGRLAVLDNPVGRLVAQSPGADDALVEEGFHALDLLLERHGRCCLCLLGAEDGPAKVAGGALGPVQVENVYVPGEPPVRREVR